MIKKLKEKYSSMSVPMRASIWFIACNCIQSGIKFLSLPIFANILSVDEYGIVTLYASWMTVLYILTTFAFGRANGVFYVAMVKFPKNREKFTTSIAALSSLLCLVLFSGIIGLTAITGDWMGIGIGQYPAMCLELIGYAILMIWSLKQRYSYSYIKLLLVTAIYSIGSIIVPIICIVLCPKDISPSAIKNWSCALFSIVLGICLFVGLYRKNKTVYSKKYWLYALKFNIVLIPHYLSGVILSQSDRIMIARISGNSYAAIYNVAYTLGVAAQTVTQALLNAISPWLYKRINKNNTTGISTRVCQITGLVALLVLMVCLVIPEVFVLFPDIYRQALYVIPPVASGVVWAFIFNIFASIELYYSGNKYVSFSSMTGAIVNIILNAILIPKIGFIAAAYTTLACDVIYAGMHTHFSMKLTRKNGKEKAIINPVPVWSVGAVSTVLCLVIMLLYPFRAVRYGLACVALLICMLSRRKIAQVIRIKKRKE